MCRISVYRFFNRRVKNVKIEGFISIIKIFIVSIFKNAIPYYIMREKK